jgi:hypothetical protein
MFGHSTRTFVIAGSAAVARTADCRERAADKKS